MTFLKVRFTKVNSFLSYKKKSKNSMHKYIFKKGLCMFIHQNRLFLYHYCHCCPLINSFLALNPCGIFGYYDNKPLRLTVFAWLLLLLIHWNSSLFLVFGTVPLLHNILRLNNKVGLFHNIRLVLLYKN